MFILGIESSCDETAFAVLKTPRTLLSSVIASQNEIHERFGGVVPELASRRHMEMIVPLFNLALEKAGMRFEEIDGVAVTRAPGLMGALLVGLSFAKAVSYASNKPIIGVNHLEGHLNAAFIEHENISYPHIGLVVSGGHTSLYLVKGFGKYKLLGATRDDAAGEAFDKVAKLLGLGYPGGPIIDKTAKEGNSKAFKFTRPKLNSGSIFEVGELDFSFSGLKTAVMLEFKRNLHISKKDMAASFQGMVVNILTTQIIKACRKYNCKAAVISGGVAANSELREKLKRAGEEEGIEVFLPSMKFCTDNAAMVAYIGGRYLEMGKNDGPELSATANEEIGV